MKLLFLSGHYPPNTAGGGEVSTHLIARGLVQAGHDVQVVCEGKYKEVQELDGVHILRLPISLTKKVLHERSASMRMAKQLEKEVRLQDFDAIHAHDFRSTLVLSHLTHKNRITTVRDYAQIAGDTNHYLLNGTIPTDPFDRHTIWQSHRVQEKHFPQNLMRFAQYMLNVKYRFEAFKSISNHIYISNAQKEEIAKFQDLSNHHAEVIYNPVAPEYLSEPLKAGQRGHVLYVGRVENYKGVNILIQAWPNIVKKHPEAKLTIIGNGAQKKMYEHYVEARGLQYSVSFESHIPYVQMIHMYDHASIVVAPHMWIEPYGRTVVEGMARGKIVISSNIGGPTEVIKDGENGYLVDPGSPEDIEASIERILGMDRYDKKRIQQAAQQWVRDHVTIDQVAEKYTKYYGQLEAA